VATVSALSGLPPRDSRVRCVLPSFGTVALVGSCAHDSVLDVCSNWVLALVCVVCIV
jgi:hypothetical protein